MNHNWAEQQAARDAELENDRRDKKRKISLALRKALTANKIAVEAFSSNDDNGDRFKLKQSIVEVKVIPEQAGYSIRNWRGKFRIIIDENRYRIRAHQYPERKDGFDFDFLAKKVLEALAREAERDKLLEIQEKLREEADVIHERLCDSYNIQDVYLRNNGTPTNFEIHVSNLDETQVMELCDFVKHLTIHRKSIETTEEE